MGKLNFITAFYDSEANTDDWVKKNGSRRRIAGNSATVSTVKNRLSLLNIQKELGIVYIKWDGDSTRNQQNYLSGGFGRGASAYGRQPHGFGFGYRLAP